jgi:HD-like signal output (HDOD) protein
MHVVKTMPAAPQILSKLGQMTLDPNMALDDVIVLLRCDPALTARIIRVANSPVYSAGSEYSSIEEALARVGMSEIYRIAGFAALLQTTEQNLRLYCITGADLRRNSLLTALIMDALAGSAGADIREAYSAGLLRSLGKIALEGLIHSAGLLRSRANIALGGLSSAATRRPTYDPQSCAPLADWESELIGLSNCEAAAFVLSEWRFPEGIASAIGHHYAPLKAPSPGLASLLNLAAGAADRLGYGLACERAYWGSSPENLAAAGVSESQLAEACEEGLRRFSGFHAVVS